MANFKFRFDSVLRLRAQIKDQKQMELRALYTARRNLVAEIDAHEKELSEDSHSDAEIFTAPQLRLRAEHSQSLIKRIEERRVALTALDDKLVEKRAELVEAMRGVKSLEQLRLRHEERYWRAQNATEQRFVDEIAQRKFAQPQDRKKIPN
jgi:flagellar export protein FliJ